VKKFNPHHPPQKWSSLFEGRGPYVVPAESGEGGRRKKGVAWSSSAKRSKGRGE